METIVIIYNSGKGVAASLFLEDMVNLTNAFKKDNTIHFINGASNIVYTKDTRYMAVSASIHNLRGMRADYIYYDSTLSPEIVNYIESCCVKQKNSLIKINLN